MQSRNWKLDTNWTLSSFGGLGPFGITSYANWTLIPGGKEAQNKKAFADSFQQNWKLDTGWTLSSFGPSGPFSITSYTNWTLILGGREARYE